MHRYGEMCYFDLYFNRLRKIIKVADDYEVDTLLIGAWGRGVFRNDPAVIKQAVNEAMKGARHIQNVYYTTKGYTGSNGKADERVFLKEKERRTKSEIQKENINKFFRTNFNV